MERKTICKVPDCPNRFTTEERDPKVFDGKGRPREFCSDRCRQRWHRRQLAFSFSHASKVEAAKTTVSEVMRPLRLKNKTVELAAELGRGKSRRAKAAIARIVG